MDPIKINSKKAVVGIANTYKMNTFSFNNGLVITRGVSCKYNSKQSMATQYGSTLENVSEASQQKNVMSGSSAFPTTNSSCSYLCANRYNLRLFRNKGAVLVLLLSFCGDSAFHFLIGEEYRSYNRKSLLSMPKFNRFVRPVVLFTMCLLFYPLFGWLADVYFQRYKVVKWSFRIAFIALSIFCLLSAALKTKHHGWEVGYPLYGLIVLGLGGFQANIVQLGMDQLTDASSAEIMSFFRWYAWGWILCSILVDFSQSCLCLLYEPVTSLLFPALVALAICLDMLCNHWLVKEKTSRNPLTLIFKVLRYAAKNKYPRLRNAFSYWDDRQYSRIDLAKTKFGGPFTTEQVEDVKTFFRIIAVIILISIFVGFYVAVYPVFDKMLYRLNGTVQIEYEYNKDNCDYSYGYVRKCFQQIAVASSGSFVLVIFLPLFELVFQPLFARLIRPVSILTKLMVGILLLFLSLACCVPIEFVAQRQTLLSNPNYNDTCPLQVENNHMLTRVLSLEYEWMAFPCTLNRFTQFIFLTSLAEFLCAQSPHSMKGLLFGLTYGCSGLFAIVGYPVSYALQELAERKLPQRYGCTLSYLLLSVGILLAVLISALVVVKCYKRRQRRSSEDVEDEE